MFFFGLDISEKVKVWIQYELVYIFKFLNLVLIKTAHKCVRWQI